MSDIRQTKRTVLGLPVFAWQLAFITYWVIGIVRDVIDSASLAKILCDIVFLTLVVVWTVYRRFKPAK
ncbi:hypothetical protein [Telmatospirillum sp.]|uniref:hypothetical protein n=1 Tax=Telmatospirillum sp. TaxID=2079197 RepID=UPI00283DA11B|nr:hypothetical protein [Telmatospirillum sp.]MDR3436500.1 hypothetical protein [Telmatospirillum sp.]